MATVRWVRTEDELLGKSVTPDGRAVVLLARIWKRKIVRDHPELGGYVDEALKTIATPDLVESDPRPDRRRYFRRGVGPSRWLLVVVSFEQEPGRVITALATRKDPKLWKP